MLDKNITYALSLGGGGFKGSYQAGAIMALHEEGYKFSAVCGTSVGSINGMMVALEDYENMKKIWLNFKVRDVFDIQNDDLEKALSMNLKEVSIVDLGKGILDTVSDGGLDISPMIKLIDKYADEDKLREKNAQFGLVTYNQTDKKLMEIMLEDMPKGTLGDFVLASSYLPVFKKIKLGGKYYLDGGYYNVLPTNMLIERGYKNIIEIDLGGGTKTEVEENDANIQTIKTDEYIGKTILYNKEDIENAFRRGYYDGIRFCKGYEGSKYVINAPREERYYLDRLLSNGHRVFKLWKIDEEEFGSKEVTIINSFIPELIKKLDIKKPYSYKGVYIKLLEKVAEELKVEKFRVYHLIELEDEVIKKISELNKGKKKRTKKKDLIKTLELISRQG